MTTPRIIVHSFTYEGDADLAKEHALCVRQALPEAHIVIIDDGAHPCPDSVRRELEALGAEWRVSYWNRNRNLYGPEAIRGIVDEMLSSATDDNDVLVKIDPDTALLNGKELLAFAHTDKVVWGSASKACPMHGCAYAIRAHALKKARQVLKIKELTPRSPEDGSIGGAVLYLFPDKEQQDLSHPCNREHPHSIWAGYHWGCYPNTTSYRRFSVVVTGNRPEPPLTRAHRVEVMRSLRTARTQNTNK